MNACRVWWENQKVRDHYEDLDINGRIVLKWLLEKYDRELGLDSSG